MAICLFDLPKEVRESIRLYHFEPYVKKAGRDDCWEWTGSKSNGYGRVTRLIEVEGQKKKKEKKFLAHRLAWMFRYNCPVPAELDCCHTCDNPGCSNPEHLFIGTAKMNTHDAMRKGRFKRINYDMPSIKRMPAITTREKAKKIVNPRVLEVAEAILKGLSCAAAARMFGISKKTASVYLRSAAALEKYGYVDLSYRQKNPHAPFRNHI